MGVYCSDLQQQRRGKTENIEVTHRGSEAARTLAIQDAGIQFALQTTDGVSKFGQRVILKLRPEYTEMSQKYAR